MLIIIVFVSLCIFYYLSKKAKIKRERRREYFEEKKDALIDYLKEKKILRQELSK